jgi:hypothetical protein
MAACLCRWCIRHAELAAIKERGDPAEMRIAIDQLWDELGNTADDLNYHQAIADGSWPSAEAAAHSILRKIYARK